MSQVTIVNKSQVFAAATAISAVGLLVVPAPAQAEPMFPLAPACSQYKFIGDFALNQSNGYRVEFPSQGPAASGRATATGGNGSQMFGNVSGGIQGRTVDFTIRWDGGGAVGHYTGYIGDDDFVHGGLSVDEKTPSSRANWDSTVPFGCADAPPAAKTATVVGEDVDVYNAKNEPDGAGQVVGVLPVGTQVQLAGSCAPSSWCRVTGTNVPGGNGWVWGHLQF
jgi:hypothetical protein